MIFYGCCIILWFAKLNLIPYRGNSLHDDQLPKELFPFVNVIDLANLLVH